MDIAGKTALVLGAARGIGLAVARRLAAEGARLVLTRYDWPEDGDAMEREFREMDAGHRIVSLDLRNRGEVENLAALIAQKSGRLHILVNNIERGGMPVVHGSYDLQVNRDQWDREMDTTLKAKWLVFHHTLPLLKKARQATVVNISSIAGIVGRSGPAALLFNDGYVAANRAVSSLTETWARQGAPSVRVNELMLGLIRTRHAEKTRGWDLLDKKQRQALLDHTLIGRTGTPDDVVRAVLFLIRDGDFMTGSVIRLDGGFVLGGENVPPMPPGILQTESAKKRSVSAR